MFSRLADAGPSAVADFAFLVETSLAAGRSFTHKWDWATTHGRIILAAFRGLAKLGPEGKAAGRIVIAALKDDLAPYLAPYADGDFQPAGMEALISMGEVEALRGLYAGTHHAARVEALLRAAKPADSTPCPK